MKTLHCLFALAVVALLGSSALAAENKRLLLVTDSGGFIHDSVGVAEQILKDIGPKNGIDVTCYRYTRDPKDPKFAKYAEDFRKRTGVPVEPENCGRVNAETLKKFDCVLFFTTGNPLNRDEVADLAAWVKAGGAIAGTHCGADTLYPDKPDNDKRPWNAVYGELVGAYFKTHPPGFQKIKIKVEDAKHPAGKSFKNDEPYEDEMYIFRDEPYSRERLHIILSVTPDTVNSLLAKAPKAARSDNDYAISWCQEVGKGRSFYTSLGHRKEVWQDKRYQEHLIGGLKWAMKLVEGDATPSAKLSK
jgi:type 1 glutamine amidotransferase